MSDYEDMHPLEIELVISRFHYRRSHDQVLGSTNKRFRKYPELNALRAACIPFRYRIPRYQPSFPASLIAIDESLCASHLPYLSDTGNLF